MQPVPPTESAGTSQSLCPARAENSDGLKEAATRVTLAMPPQVNYRAKLSASFEAVSDSLARTYLDSYNVGMFC